MLTIEIGFEIMEVALIPAFDTSTGVCLREIIQRRCRRSISGLGLRLDADGY